MFVLKVLLFPVSLLYGLMTRLRNHLYDIGQKRAFRFDANIISVGNLAVGGTGKSPMVEYLIRLLNPKYKIATLSRGYGRQTSGIRFAGEHDTALTIGDEPFQFFSKFAPAVSVVVGEERAIAIPEILHSNPDTDAILLDDAFQHRKVVPQLSILLTTFQAPFYHDLLLPAGRLRESRKGAARADIVVVTKCPEATTEPTLTDMTTAVRKFAGEKPVFFSTLRYQQPVAFGESASRQIGKTIILVSGIATPDLFEDWTASHFSILEHFRFRDHHQYSTADLESMLTFYKAQDEGVSFLTTEKDMVRLTATAKGSPLFTQPWFYVPIEVEFLKNGSDFDKLVVSSIQSHQTKS